MENICTGKAVSNSDLQQLQLEQSPVQPDLPISRHDLETSGIAIQTGTRDYDTLVQATSHGEEITNCVCALVVQISA